MKITVNGKETEITSPTTLLELITSLNYDTRLIAVELNGTIPSKSEYGNITLDTGDTVEIVTFMGGG